MRSQPNPAHLDKRPWPRPQTRLGWFLWALCVVGGLIAVALLKGAIPAAVLAVIVAALAALQWRR
jgi:hypothetical protein